ncbi:hypothetical protein APHAL10511_002521 [Amanita phalloides]|nr:hypothetical protein APHAL10511_002521 [Amanita phalloides]
MDIAGAWSAFLDDVAIYDELTDDYNNLPDLVSIDDSLDIADDDDELEYPEGHGQVMFKSGFCSEEAIPCVHCHDDDDEPGPAAFGLETSYPHAEDVFVSVYAMAYATFAYLEHPSLFWDMYDLGMSHHMSPLHEDFINFMSMPT